MVTAGVALFPGAATEGLAIVASTSTVLNASPYVALVVISTVRELESAGPTSVIELIVHLVLPTKATGVLGAGAYA